jgi:hypothetical protein
MNPQQQIPLFPQKRSKLSGLDLTSFNRCSKNVIVEVIIVPELELRNVKVQILLADVMECADDAALAGQCCLTAARTRRCNIATEASRAEYRSWGGGSRGRQDDGTAGLPPFTT